MEDREIVNLYWQRNQTAISQTEKKYGGYCKSIAKNILGNNEDVEECVNDTYLNVWNSIPPHRPKGLSAFLGKITRNIAFDKLRRRNADKRGGGEINLVLDELAECVSGRENTEQAFAKKLLVKEINSFLDELPREKCNIFLCRYWYAMPVSQIAEKFGMTENNVSVNLSRMRKKLKDYLTERGYDL